MKTLRIIVCALLCVVFCAAAAGAAEVPDFHGFTGGMTREQGDAEAKKQGLAVQDTDPEWVKYKGTLFGLPDQVLNAIYADGKLTEVTIILWATINNPKGLSDEVLEAKGKELLAAFKEKYGEYTSEVSEVTKKTTHTWNLPGKNTLMLIIGGEDDRTITVFAFSG